MTYSIVYTTQTGNTALLAQRIRDTLPQEACVYCGAPALEGADGDLVFAGFWTDKGVCGEALAAFLANLRDKRVFLFGTAGFGGSEAYFGRILAGAAAHLGAGCALAGQYMCQGKMPPSVGERYAALAQQNPDKGLAQLENYNRALSHPDETDLTHLENQVRALL